MRLRMDLNVPIHRAAHSIQMNALVRAVPAGDVAKLAADTKRLIDLRDNPVVQVQVLPLSDPGQALSCHETAPCGGTRGRFTPHPRHSGLRSTAQVVRGHPDPSTFFRLFSSSLSKQILKRLVFFGRMCPALGATS